MKKLALIPSVRSALVALLTAPLVAGAQSSKTSETLGSTASQDSANAVLRRYVDAIGGVANIARVQTRAMKGAMSLGRGIRGAWQEELQTPDLAVEHGSARAWFGWSGEFGAGYDGRGAWEFAPGETPHSLDSALARAYLRQHRLDRDTHLAEIFPVRSLLKDRTIDGRPQRVVRMQTTSGDEETWFLDSATGLLSRIERLDVRAKNETVRLVMTFDDYRDVNGVQLPHLLGIDNGDRPVMITITSIVDNTPIDPSHFVRPYGAKAP